MPAKLVEIEGLGTLHINKRRGIKNMSIRVAHDGTIKLNLPWFVASSQGLKFVDSKRKWLLRQKANQTTSLSDGDPLGPLTLRLNPSADDTNRWEISANELTIIYPKDQPQIIPEITAKALDSLARKLLPEQVELMANKYNFNYKKLRFSKATTRWGSYSSAGTISLNVQLMRLPLELRDYVIIHELCHSRQMNHSSAFWQLVKSCDPHYKKHRKSLRSYSPYL